MLDIAISYHIEMSYFLDFKWVNIITESKLCHSDIILVQHLKGC